MGLSFYKVAVALALVSTTAAHAYESEDTHGYTDSWDASILSRPAAVFPRDGSRIQKFNIALDAIGIPQESEPDFSEFPTDGLVLQGDLSQRLKYIDPQSGLQRYLNFAPDQLNLYQDFFSSLLPAGMLEYTANLTGSGENLDSKNLIDTLTAVGNQVKDPTNEKPLQGLKIVIDPGHMGTPFWDDQTGKYVKSGTKKVSEGQLNLWTSFLVANELEALGATVVLTRTQDGPVSQNNYQNFDLSPYINQYFYSSLDDWMGQYLNLSDAALRSTIKTKPEVKKAFTASQRVQFFISGEDLEARSQIVDREQPQIMIDIHHDASLTTIPTSRTANPRVSHNALEAFVPGTFFATETGSKIVRSEAVKHLLEARRWNESVNLASDVVSAMSASEHIGLETSTDFIGSTKVKNGVYARNLYINRRNLSALTVYLECLHYDDPVEFNKLANKDAVGNYHGISFPYPSRLKDSAVGIRNGIITYFKR
jgi:N-acetylmuramoyl-L-alanine amidase